MSPLLSHSSPKQKGSENQCSVSIKHGTIAIPSDVLAEYGIYDGDTVRVVKDDYGIWMERGSDLSPEQARALEDDIDETERQIADGIALSFSSIDVLKDYLPLRTT